MYRSTEAVCVSQDQTHTPRRRSSASPYSTPQQQTSGRWQFCSLRSFTDICPSKALMPFSMATSRCIPPYQQVNTQTCCSDDVHCPDVWRLTALSELFPACHDLIFHCLSRNPAHRLTLQQLEEHRWMKA